MTNSYRMSINTTLLLFVATFGLTACGGGGGGDNSGGGGTGNSGSNSVQYSGNTQAADVTENNSKAITGGTFDGSDAADAATQNFTQPSFSGGKKPGGNARQFIANKLRTHTGIFSQSLQLNADKLNSKTALPGASLVVDETRACPNGGTAKLSGEVDDTTRLGSVTVTYSGCSDGYVIVNGSATLSALAYNASIDKYTDVKLSLNDLNFVGVNPADNIDWHVGADFRAQLDYSDAASPATYTSTIDMIIEDSLTAASFKYENYVTEAVVNNYTTPTAFTLTVNGRIYHYLHGYVDIVTSAPLNYSSMTQRYPDAGGPLTYIGALNKKIRLTPVNAVLVNVSVDADGDNFFEFSLTLPWQELNNDRPNNNAPVANAGNDVIITLGNTAQLDGSQSVDADYNLLTYVWTVISQPVGSNAGLAGSGAVNPTLTPDMVGTYDLQMRVSDGTYVDTDLVTVTVN